MMEQLINHKYRKQYIKIIIFLIENYILGKKFKKKFRPKISGLINKYEL